jgi:signal transduction histidine kinase
MFDDRRLARRLVTVRHALFSTPLPLRALARRRGARSSPSHPRPVADLDHMPELDRLSKLRHDLSNPLSALLAETQLLLLNESQIDPVTATGLKEIEALAIRMRTMLREI